MRLLSSLHVPFMTDAAAPRPVLHVLAAFVLLVPWCAVHRSRLPRHKQLCDRGSHFLCVPCYSLIHLLISVNYAAGSLKWYSRLYRNQGSLLYGPGPFDWGEQIIVITGGESRLMPNSSPVTSRCTRCLGHWRTSREHLCCAQCHCHCA